jgi:hypothetical protein
MSMHVRRFRQKSRLFSIVAALLLLGTFTSSLAGASSHTVLFEDDFASFDAASGTGNWFYFSDGGSFTGNDGVEDTSGEGLTVKASGTNAATGEPAYTLTVPQDDDPSTLPGGLDHVKWLVVANRFSSNSVPGFDAVVGEELVGGATYSGETFGTAGHPFQGAVKNANDDARLAAGALNGIDFETFMVFDFFVTNERLYAIYERLPFGRPFLGNYASFTFLVPLMDRVPADEHELQIAYDREAGVVRWLVSGQELFRVDKIGYRIDRDYMVLDHGGVEETVEPRQLNFGMGMFTLLDADVLAKKGLVKLSNIPDTYFDPTKGEPKAQKFEDTASETSSRLFGQGAELRVKDFLVNSRPAPD